MYLKKQQKAALKLHIDISVKASVCIDLKNNYWNDVIYVNGYVWTLKYDLFVH